LFLRTETLAGGQDRVELVLLVDGAALESAGWVHGVVPVIYATGRLRCSACHKGRPRGDGDLGFADVPGGALHLAQRVRLHRAPARGRAARNVRSSDPLPKIGLLLVG
jgi:hypothetical protein